MGCLATTQHMDDSVFEAAKLHSQSADTDFSALSRSESPDEDVWKNCLVELHNEVYYTVYCTTGKITLQ